MTITREAFLAACQRHYKVRAFDERLSQLFAEDIAARAQADGRLPHFGGGVQDHRMGKLGELVFENWLYSRDLAYRERCRCPWPGPMDHTDYVVESPQGLLSCDVKSGKLFQGQGFDEIPIDRFGLQVPVEQIRDDMPLIYPYVLFDSLLQTGVFVGYAYRFEVQAQPVRDTYHRCHQVPISQLHPVGDLYKLLVVDGGAESLEKIALIRS